MPDLLIELLSEEIPARMQARAAEDLRRMVTEGMVDAGLTYAHAGSFATPRRLVLVAEGLPDASAVRQEQRRGPKVGAPDQAIDGFCKGAGVSREALEIREEKKGAFYVASIRHPGRDAGEIIAEVLEAAIRNFPWPKSMRWGAGSLRWVRPLTSILAILHDSEGARVVPLEVDGIRAGQVTRGHPVLAPEPIKVQSFEHYQQALAAARVVLSAEERRARISHDAEQAAFAAGLSVLPDDALLAEIAGLVEWPNVLAGRIEERFLALPPEVLQVSMRVHQKFLALFNPKTERVEGFVTVADTETTDGGAVILAGNARVLAARLGDAAFFWQNDLRRVAADGLEGLASGLGAVTFHARLGSLADKVARMEALAGRLAPAFGAAPDAAREAARIAKADLVSEMVYEFPELQGVMGRYYAKAAGHSVEVAEAVEQHYRPQGPADSIPEGAVSRAVAVAEKLDILAGFWAIDERPTGSKDPFALRRAALGLIRILVEGGHSLNLRPAIATALAPYDAAAGTAEALLSFIHERMKVWLRDRGVAHDVIDACLGHEGADDLGLLVARSEALGAFLASEDGTNLLQGFRRANNILAQAEAEDGVEYSFGADVQFAETEAEHALFAAIATVDAALNKTPMDSRAGVDAAMHQLAALRAPVDAFFEAVQINTESALLRRNRLNLLSQIRSLCLRVADLTRLEG